MYKTKHITLCRFDSCIREATWLDFFGDICIHEFRIMDATSSMIIKDKYNFSELTLKPGKRKDII